jgi:hypothetical protein
MTSAKHPARGAYRASRGGVLRNAAWGDSARAPQWANMRAVHHGDERRKKRRFGRRTGCSSRKTRRYRCRSGAGVACGSHGGWLPASCSSWCSTRRLLAISENKRRATAKSEGAQRRTRAGIASCAGRRQSGARAASHAGAARCLRCSRCEMPPRMASAGRGWRRVWRIGITAITLCGDNRAAYHLLFVHWHRSQGGRVGVAPAVSRHGACAVLHAENRAAANGARGRTNEVAASPRFG